MHINLKNNSHQQPLLRGLFSMSFMCMYGCVERIFGIIPAKARIHFFFVMLNLFQHFLQKILKQVQDDLKIFFLDSRLGGNDILDMLFPTTIPLNSEVSTAS